VTVARVETVVVESVRHTEKAVVESVRHTEKAVVESVRHVEKRVRDRSAPGPIRFGGRGDAPSAPSRRGLRRTTADRAGVRTAVV
jgi:hypothetical protein